MTTDKPIPDAIMREARSSLDGIVDQCQRERLFLGTVSAREVVLHGIARALMARDERAAKIAEEWSEQLVTGELVTWHANRIATAIRNGGEA